MNRALAKVIDYQQNPILLCAVYAYVMADKLIRSIFVPGYKPKRLYF